MMVSVIIPCYNQGAYIQEAIDSVIVQTYTDWEIIIVNDGSTDEETITVLDQLSEQGYNIIHQKNRGVSVARNVGIGESKGEYILPLDADDKIGNTYIEKALKVLTENDRIKLVYANAVYFGEKNEPMQLPDFSMEGMLNENLIYNAAIFRRTDFFNTAGYDPSFTIGWEDWEFWLRFITNEDEVHKLDDVLFFYRQKEVSRNADLVAEKLQLCEQQLFSKHINLFLKKYKNPISFLREANFYKAEYNKLDDYRKELLQSKSYKIGNAILSPLKLIKEVFKK